VNIFNGEHWLNDTPLESNSLASWNQTLNTYEDCLLTRYDWMDEKKRTSIQVDAFVSRADPNLAAVKITLTPRYSGPVRVLLPIRSWKAPVRQPVGVLERFPPDAQGNRPNIRYTGYMVVKDRHVETGLDRGLVRVVSRADGGTTDVAEVIALSWANDLPQLSANGIVSDELACGIIRERPAGRRGKRGCAGSAEPRLRFHLS
jgi:hypothetical protein